LILGSSSGFGAATCRALAADGFNIYGVHLDRRSTMPMVAEVIADCEGLGAEVHFCNINAADEAKRNATLDSLRARLDEDGGTVVVLFHSLAFGTLVRYVSPPQEDGATVSSKQMTMTQEVMANSLVYWTQGLMERGLMECGARVFAMTSTGGSQVSPSYGVVSSAKAALEAHCRQLAYELLPHGITANSICAGVTDTPALKKIPGADKLKAKSLDKSPIDRLTHPEDVGGAVAALVDPRLHWMTGNVLGIHGGEPFIG
jgi:NAD(P)-dependent dehydrogenase (short-subunit alcohol dehydrogenase family)